MERYVCGLDFGTSNSSIAIYDLLQKSSSPHNAELTTPVPSVLYFPKRSEASALVGKQAINRYVASNFQGRFLQSLKSFLADPTFSGTIINGQHWTLEDLIAAILEHLKREGEKRIGVPLLRCVMGRPVRFVGDATGEELAMDRLRKAAEQAGFVEVSFELEPIAAARFYQTLTQEEELVLVGDFGGGTSDFTLIALSPKGSSSNFNVLGTAGVPIAGNVFDSAIMRRKLLKHFGYGSKWLADDKWLDMPAHIFSDLCEWHQVPFLRDRRMLEFLRGVRRHTTDPTGIDNLITLIFNNVAYMLFQRIEFAKIDLSVNVASAVEYIVKDLILRETLTLSEFNSLIDSDLTTIVESAQQLLHSRHIDSQKVDKVFLTGGTSQVRALKSKFAEMFAPEKIRTNKTFTSVSEGLGIAAGMSYERLHQAKVST